MAAEEERESNAQAAEITSLDNPIQDSDLELSLGPRPSHSHSHSHAHAHAHAHSQSHAHAVPHTPTFQNLPEPADPLPAHAVSRLRRHVAKRKRDMKRLRDDGAVTERCRNGKVPCLNASFCPPPAWWAWTPPAAVGPAPFQQGQNGNFVVARDGESGPSVSGGSSSGLSDNYLSTSGPGGSSSVGGSHLSNPHPNSQIQLSSSQSEPRSNGSTVSNPQSQLRPTTSGPIEPMLSSAKTSDSPEAVDSSNTSPHQHERTRANQSPTPNRTKGEPSKPPKPNGQADPQSLMLSQMPCVSATGNGPIGKTITGFLYKYTKLAEVSIVCVCHGKPFSPAGFVEHAGGVDVEHPLKLIRVVPFSFG